MFYTHIKKLIKYIIHISLDEYEMLQKMYTLKYINEQ